MKKLIFLLFLLFPIDSWANTAFLDLASDYHTGNVTLPTSGPDGNLGTGNCPCSLDNDNGGYNGSCQNPLANNQEPSWSLMACDSGHKNVRYPTTPSLTGHTNGGNSSNGSFDVYNFGTIAGVGTATQIDLYVYAQTSQYNYCDFGLIVNGTANSTYFNNVTGGYQSGEWFQFTWSGLSLSQSDLNTLQVFQNWQNNNSGGFTTYAIYAVVTYTPSSVPPHVTSRLP